MTQLSDAMNLNLEMYKKLNLKATQVKYPKVNKLAYKTKIKSAFKGTWNRMDTGGHMGSELPSGTAAKRAQHQLQDTKGQQR